MPKPTADDIFDQIDGPTITASIAASRIARLVDAWEAEVASEPDRFRAALEKIASADLKRTSAGYLQQIATEALK